MVLPHVLLRVLPELVVVLALHEVATDARDLFHALIVWRDAPKREATASKLDERFAKSAAATLASTT